MPQLPLGFTLKSPEEEKLPKGFSFKIETELPSGFSLKQQFQPETLAPLPPDVSRETALPDIQQQLQDIPRPEFKVPEQVGAKEPQQFRIEEPSPAEAFVDTAKILGSVGAGMADFMFSAISGNFAGAKVLADKIFRGKTWEEALKSGEETLKAFPQMATSIPEPESEAGKKTLEKIHWAMEVVFKKPGEFLAQAVPEGFPNTKAVVATLTEGITFGMLHVAGARYKASKKLIEDVKKSGKDLSVEETNKIIADMKGEVKEKLEPDIIVERPLIEAPKPEIKPEPVKEPTKFPLPEKEIAKLEAIKKELPKEIKPEKPTAELITKLKEEVGAIGRENITESVKKAAKANPEASKALRIHEITSAEVKQQKTFTFEKFRKTFTNKIIDVSGTLKRKLVEQGGDSGKRVVIQHDVIAGASSEAKRQYGVAEKSIWRGLSKSENEVLNYVIEGRRIIAIDKYKKDVKHPLGTTGKQQKAFIDSLPKDIKEKLVAKADKYFEETKKQPEKLRDAGIITEESYQSIIEKGDYSPRWFIQHINPEKIHNMGGRKISVPDSGIKALDEGSLRALEKDSNLLLAHTIAITEARIFRNNASKALYDFAQKNPDNTIVKIAKPIRVTKDGKAVYAPAPGGFEKISVVIDGVKKEMLMPTEMATEWVLRDPQINSQLANTIGWLSGAKVLRATATGLNPEFAITNFPRDIAHLWFVTREYSKHLPVSIPQLGIDLATVLTDAMTKKGRYIEYIKEGGGMDFLTHQGRIANPQQGVFKAMQEFAGYLGETSEILTRLALRERAIKNNKSPQEATWIARNYIDFSQGGSWIKALDAGVPYLNAGIQGTRGIFRAFKENPKVATYKFAQIGTIAAALYTANKMINSDAYDAISEHEKANYWIITTPINGIDKKGNKRYLYFRIAKDHGQRAGAAIFEGLMAKSMGEEINIEQITQAAKSFLPYMPTENLPPAMTAILGYYANKDFWRNKDIWNKYWKRKEIGEKGVQEEYLPWTHPALVKGGQIFNFSPERMRYSLGQFFASNNVFVGLVGNGLRSIMDELPNQKEKELMDKINYDVPFLRRFLHFTKPPKKEKEKKKTFTLPSGRTPRFIKKPSKFKVSKKQLEDIKKKREALN